MLGIGFPGFGLKSEVTDSEGVLQLWSAKGEFPGIPGRTRT